MSANRSNFSIPQPHPGEIWEVSCDDPRSDRRYVQIVREPQADAMDGCVVMLLSIETQYLSNVDLLIPAEISGLDRDILAQTWNVAKISIACLKRRVGQRLSRQIYDLTLTIGDIACGLSGKMPTPSEIRALKLLILPARTEENDDRLARFHQHERSLLASFDRAKISAIERALATTIAIEREFIELVRERIYLAEWFQQIVPPQWQDASEFAPEGMAIATRNSTTDRGIEKVIAEIAASDDELHRQQLIQELGKIGNGNSEAIAALVNSIETTQNDEILWIAVASLRQLAPAYPSVGIRRLKSVDLEPSVNFVINIVPKSNDRFAILLQVYPSGESTLPIDLKLILQDEAGNSLREVVAGERDYCIQLKLSGRAREIFSVCLELDGRESIEDFVI